MISWSPPVHCTSQPAAEVSARSSRLERVKAGVECGSSPLIK